MLINIKGFNGYNLANTSYKAVGTSMRSQSEASPVFIDQANAESEDSGAYTLGVKTIPVKVRILDIVNQHALSAQLREALKPGTSGILLATFSDEVRDYQITCRIQSIIPDETYSNQFMVIFQTGLNCWISADEVTDSWAITASGDEKAITVGGYSETRLSLSLTATGLPANGWAYQKLYQLVNPLVYAYGKRPWCITLDTAALVTAGKCQADCDDLVVVVDGVITRRWLAAPNTLATKIWVNLNLIAGQSMTLLTPVASSGSITELSFELTANNMAAMSKLPTKGIVYHGSEWFEYSSWSYSRTSVKLFGVKRGAMSTTLQAHVKTDAFRFIQHVIHILYGNSAAVSPDLIDANYDNEKPIFDLASSTNASWVYTATTGFYDPAFPTRPGAWKPVITKYGTESENYFVKENAESGDPAMGMRIASYLKLGKITGDSVTAYWLMNCPGLISSVSATGRKYRSHVQWAALKAFRLDRSINQVTWVEVWNELTPTVAAAWETVTKASQAITPNMANVRFVLTGTIPAVVDVQNMAEILTCSVDFVSGNLPIGTFLSEKSNYLLDVIITNETTGDALELVYPMLLNVAMDVDSEEFAVTYGEVNAHSAMSLNDDSRDLWLRLNPGTNTIKITGNDVGTLTAVFRWQERRR